MAINFDIGKFLVLNEALLPFGLKGRLREPYPEKKETKRKKKK